MARSLSRKQNVDRGWAWVVLITSFFTRIVIGGLMWAVNQYFVLFHKEFGQNRSLTAIIGSIMYATYFSAAPVASVLIQTRGLRLTTIVGVIMSTASYVINYFANSVVFLILTHGFLLGIGLCFISNASLISLGQYFKKFNYIVTGVSLAGTGVGVFIFAVLIPYLLDTYGWRGSMFIMAGIVLQISVSGCVLFPLERDESLKVNDTANAVLDKTPCFKDAIPLLVSMRFWCCNLSQFFFCMSVISLIILYKDFAIVRNFYSSFAWSVAAFGGGDIGGRLLSGFLISFPCCEPSLLLFFFGLSCVIFLMIEFVVLSAFAFIICSFVLGLGIGSQVTLHYILPNDVFGREKYIVALGYVQTTAGLGSLLGPPVAGFITDADPEYAWTFIFIALLQLVSSLLVLFVFVLQRKKKEKQRNLEMESRTRDDQQREMVAFVPKPRLSKRGTQISLELFVSTASVSYSNK